MIPIYASLEGKITVVTGAAGILGSEVVSQLLSSGAIVCAVDTNRSAMDSVLGSNNGLHKFECDVSSDPQVVEVIDAIEEKVGPIYALHNNAATKTASLENFFGETLDYDLKTWHEVMNVNLTGMYLMARSALRFMVRRREGNILQTASIYGSTMGPDQRIYKDSRYLGLEISTPVIYTVSKAGVHGLTNHLATEFGKAGIRVNTLSPGGISSGQNEQFELQYSQRIPLGRMARVHEVASAAVFIMSPDASYISGQNILTDGGLSAW